MRLLTMIPAAVACALALSPSSASAGVVGQRVPVCAPTLELNSVPDAGRDGVLAKGETVAVRKLSDSGKYAYGLAYGNINRDGWVLTRGLCGSDRAVASLSDRLVGNRVRVCRADLELDRAPNQGWDGVLAKGETVAVRKLSDSGKYAYGLAYGNINRDGWVLTSGLCGSDPLGQAGATTIVGRRVAVEAPELRVYERPNQSGVGALHAGETFRVSKLSDSGKYAYGVAYGQLDKVGWVLAGGLAQGS